MKKTLNPTLSLLFILPFTAAKAETSFTAGLYSDYVFRGISQTDEDPTLQASIDFASEHGWYGGIWASDVDYGESGDYEVDFLGGYAGTTEHGMGYDIQAVYYTYPSSDNTDNYPELILSLDYRFLNAVLAYTPDNFGLDESALYYQIGAEFELGNDVLMHLSAGLSDFDKADRQFFASAPDSYSNWNIGISKSWNGFDFTLDYHATNSDADALFGDDISDDRIVFSVARTFDLQN